MRRLDWGGGSPSSGFRNNDEAIALYCPHLLQGLFESRDNLNEGPFNVEGVDLGIKSGKEVNSAQKL